MAQHNYNQEPADAPENTEALCAQFAFGDIIINPDWWFEPVFQGGHDAIKICNECPLKAQCAEYAITQGEEYGIWGGLTADDRKRLRKRNIRIKNPLN